MELGRHTRYLERIIRAKEAAVLLTRSKETLTRGRVLQCCMFNKLEITDLTKLA